MVKVNITSDIPIDFFFIEDLEYHKVKASNDQELDLQPGWYELQVPYLGQTVNISAITINGVNLEYLIYTGYFENAQGKTFQPATAMWEPGMFRFWFHTNVGYFFASIYEQISNGHHGTNLFEKYTFTIDRPLHIHERFPEKVRSFFASGEGPRWWNKQDPKCPWLYLDDDVKDAINSNLHLFEKMCSVEVPDMPDHSKLWTSRVWRLPGVSKADPVDFTHSSFYGLGVIFKRLGWKSLLSMSHNRLGPYGYIMLHVDDYTTSKNLQYIKGPSKIYYTYRNGEAVSMKLKGAGLVPNEPVLLNTNMFPHSVINDADVWRDSLTVYGVKDDAFEDDR